MTKDKALKLALDLAIMHHSDDGYAELRSKVRQLAKEALAQDEQISSQERVAIVINKGPKIRHYAKLTETGELLADGTQLYTAAPKRPWVGLTKLEVRSAHEELCNTVGSSYDTVAAAIEAILKEKNT